MKKMTINQPTNPKSIEECFTEFLMRCKRKNLSPATISDYKNQTVKFIDYFKKETAISSIHQLQFDCFVSHLQDCISNPISINTGLRHLKVFLHYLYKQGYMNLIKIEFLKVQETSKECYTDEELSLLLKKPNLKTCCFAEYRNWVSVCFLVATGCRRATLIEIKIEDVDFSNGYVKFRHTKNKKLQYIPLDAHLIEVLEKFVSVRKGEQTDYLFCSSFGGKLQPNGFYNALKDYNISRGVTKTSTHLFRHTFAKNWVLEGGDISKLQRMLGHETLEMSVHYANLYGVEVLKNTEKFNLFNRLKQPDKIKMK